MVGDDPVIYEHLGEIYHKQNQIKEAGSRLRSLEMIPPTSN
jgi:hypothetical protein